MFFVKVFGVILVCAFAATEIITFKPFVKTRYSLRERAKTTTKYPLMKTNETDVNSNSEANTQHVSVQNLATTPLTPAENDVGNDSQLLSTVEPISQPALNVETTPTNKIEVQEKEVPIGNVQSTTSITEVKTTKRPVTTTQQEWFYDYYASDDESPRKKN